MSFQPIVDLMAKFKLQGAGGLCPGDTAWHLGWLIKNRFADISFTQPNWKGFMKSLHLQHGSNITQIEYLSIIDGKADNFSTLYTAIVDCIKRSKDRPMMITFDLPLWIKGTRIILEKSLPVVPRLGGFHLAKSFLASIGYLMRGSGLEDCIRLIHNEEPDNIMSGAAYYKALRAHFIIDAALCSYLIQDCITDDELSLVQDYILNVQEDHLGCTASMPYIAEIGKRIETVLSSTASAGKTQKLWIHYHNHVQLLKDFIRAERTSNYRLHLSIIAKMMPVLASAGHGQYAKAVRLTLEMTLQFGEPENAFFFGSGHHTVKYNDAEWAGIWTDLTIEQTIL